MSTKLSSGKIAPREKRVENADFKDPTLILALENTILALEEHHSIDEIFAFVNCINKGFITNGEWNPIYLEYVKSILQEKQELERQEEFRKAFGSGSSIASS
jgi:hypothetical protein